MNIFWNNYNYLIWRKLPLNKFSIVFNKKLSPIVGITTETLYNFYYTDIK